MRFGSLLVYALASGVAFPGIGSAQPAPIAAFAREASISIAWGHLFRIGDETFGDRPNIGGGCGVRHRSGLGMEFDLNRTLGLSPVPAPCAVGTLDPQGRFVPVPCIGAGRDGVESATIASLNVLYYFSDARTTPYVTGGIGVLWSTGVSTTTFHGGGPEPAIQTEEEWRDTGAALNVGGGVRVALTPSISVRSEFRFYNSTLLSGQNLSLIRASGGVGFEW